MATAALGPCPTWGVGFVRRIRAFCVLSLVAGSALAGLTAVPANAATVTVTTTVDVVNGGDGLVSLREAVTQANASIEPTTIDLGVSQLYSLSVCGADEEGNASGDLDYTGSQPLTVNGNGSTVDAACAGQRVVDQHDETAQLTISTLTLTGGDTFNGAALRFAGDVDLNSVTASGNNAGTGSVIDSAEMVMGSSIGFVDSTVGPNTGIGLKISFGAVTITGTTFA